MNVNTAAWVAAGQPQPAANTAGHGRCAHCGCQAPRVPLAHTVSKNFTGWDRWVDPGSAGVCTACAWAHTGPGLRTEVLAITRWPSPTMQSLSTQQLGIMLGSALPQNTAITLPLTRNRTHVLPGAQWGHINIGSMPLAWTRQDAQRLTVLQRVRELGVSRSALAHPAPPWQAIARLSNPTLLGELISLWPHLESWRRRQDWLRVAIRATDQPGDS